MYQRHQNDREVAFRGLRGRYWLHVLQGRLNLRCHLLGFRGRDPALLHLVETGFGCFLVARKIDVHHVEKELCWVDLSWHWEAEGCEVWTNSSDGAEIVLLPSGEEYEFVEELESGCRWLMDACDDDQLCPVSPIPDITSKHPDIISLCNLLDK